MLLPTRQTPPGFVEPCLPSSAERPPGGPGWWHEIKHDGFRIIARKNGERVRLYSRSGNDLTHRFPLIAETLARLRSRSCIFDGEAACFKRASASRPSAEWNNDDFDVLADGAVAHLQGARGSRGFAVDVDARLWTSCGSHGRRTATSRRERPL